MVYCEGSSCKKRDTCSLHCDMEENVMYEYLDWSRYGSCSYSDGKAPEVTICCGDGSEYPRYKPSKSANITDYDYETMWMLLKPFVEKICNNPNNISVSDILFHMNILEDRFAPSFTSKVNVEDIRKDPRNYTSDLINKVFGAIKGTK